MATMQQLAKVLVDSYERPIGDNAGAVYGAVEAYLADLATTATDEFVQYIAPVVATYDDATGEYAEWGHLCPVSVAAMHGASHPDTDTVWPVLVNVRDIVRGTSEWCFVS